MSPDSNVPSWGVGIIYHHVLALNQAGFSAFIVHEKANFVLEWMHINVPILNWENPFEISSEDFLIVPEVLVNKKGLKKIKCRKIVFVQASSFLFEMMPEDETHLSLGFESAIGIMPHIIPIIEQFTGLSTVMIRPFVAQYFFKKKELLHKREKIIIVFPKFHQQDFGIVKRVISDRLKIINPSGITSFLKDKWKLIVLKNKTHKQVAELMQQASFFIATNTFESFNASCVEAMAAGCISVCYEGFGPRDYLQDGKNAFVFGNNEAYKMSEHIFNLIDEYEERQQQFNNIREEGYRLAESYNYEEMKNQLIQFYKSKF